MFSFLSNIIGHAYRWLIYLLIFVIADTVFRFAAQPIVGVVQYIVIRELNLGIYKVLPESAVVYLCNMLFFFFTAEILMIVLHHHPNHDHKQSQ